MSTARFRITKVYADSDLLEQIEPKMRNLGDAIGVRMQRLVPKRTWALHDTITPETVRTASKVTTTVTAGGGDVDYALAVERGTSRMSAQPFMRPALLQSKSRDFDFEGAVKRHGVREIVSRRERKRRTAERRRDRAADRRQAKLENGNES